MAKKKNAAAVSLGRRSGVSLTPEQRTERARRAVNTRWRKVKAPAAAEPGRWYELVAMPEFDWKGAAHADKILDEAEANPTVILWSRDRDELKARQKAKDLRDRWTEIIELKCDPTRLTIQRQYQPDTDAQLKGLKAVLDAEGGRS